jgi:hypothetical protein
MSRLMSFSLIASLVTGDVALETKARLQQTFYSFDSQYEAINKAPPVRDSSSFSLGFHFASKR